MCGSCWTGGRECGGCTLAPPLTLGLNGAGALPFRLSFYVTTACMPAARRPFNRILVAQHVTMPQMWISCLVALQVGRGEQTASLAGLGMWC